MTLKIAIAGDQAEGDLKDLDVPFAEYYRFTGEVTVDCIDRKVIIRDRLGGRSEIPIGEIEDVILYLEKCKEALRR